MDGTIGTARRESAPSTKFVVLSASRETSFRSCTRVVHPLGEPEVQLVHEEDRPVVAEGLGVLGDHREADVQRDEAMPAPSPSAGPVPVPAHAFTREA